MTEHGRREGTEKTKNKVEGKPEDATRHRDREKGGAEEVNPEGEGTAGGVKENVQDEFKEAQQD